MARIISRIATGFVILAIFLTNAAGFEPAQAAGELAIYADGLASGWADWSWNTAVNLSSTATVKSGTHSLSAQITAAWGALYLHANPAINLTGYDRLRFWVHGGSAGGQQLRVVANGSGDGYPLTLTANQWTQVTLSLADLGSPATLSDLYWQDATGAVKPVFYLDQIELLPSSGVVTPTPPPGSGPALTVNTAAGHKPISPDIYGMNYASEALANELDLPVRRWGGNSTSRYNWQVDGTNAGFDWYFENVPADNPDTSQLPDNSSADRFIQQDQRTGTQTLMTVPMIGFVAKSRKENHPYDCGFKVSKYGAQQDTDWQWDPDCGNGVTGGGQDITGNDPLDTSVAVGPAFVTSWINHLKSRFGTADSGGVRYYNLDNEPMLWNSTHRDVHPNPVTYDELRDRTYAYAAAVKAADPAALTLGPVLWGWCAYFYSAADGCAAGADRAAHGNVDFVPWYLAQMKAYETAHGVRILDYLDLHIYPQGESVALKPAGSAATQALRLRSTRALWDPTYVDESWIGQPVKLIGRMKDWVNSQYPGTKLAITEYNWGAPEHINGALAQADVLGIFGREGLDLATLWAPPAANQPLAYAFRMYRNVDGAGGRFGSTSVSAVSGDQGQLAVYAALRPDQTLTVMVINKTGGALTSALSLSGFSPAFSAQVYRYSAANLNAIVEQPAQSVSPTGFTATYPANSVTLLVIPTGIPLDKHIYIPAVRR
ncbi:MAG: glycoside hydrolase family 44 protein [Anaerolineae bacterium]|nr:glycoside hydrolase family 44 protein [Anaerolineae bacterium]